MQEKRGNDSMKKRMMASVLSMVLSVTALVTPVTAMADRVEDKPYVALGADLKGEEREVVLQLLNLTEEELENCDIAQITNEMEHKYLGAYLSADVIGSRALSSVKVVGKEAGHGIDVDTYNITYCTEGMYENALATAGVENAEVIVAGPFNISGTAALVGAMEAYSQMTGDVIDPELMDAANNELVVTSEIAENIGNSEKAEELIAAVKEIVAANGITNMDDIEAVIEDVSGKLEIHLSEEDKQLIKDLMKKLSKLDIDLEALKEQAKDLYDRVKEIDLSEYGITEESVKGFFAQLADLFSGLLEKLKSLLG